MPNKNPTLHTDYSMYHLASSLPKFNVGDEVFVKFLTFEEYCEVYGMKNLYCSGNAKTDYEKRLADVYRVKSCWAHGSVQIITAIESYNISESVYNYVVSIGLIHDACEFLETELCYVSELVSESLKELLE